MNAVTNFARCCTLWHNNHGPAYIAHLTGKG
jgi:hypothetical protein